jgi:hypothetical protein
VRHYTYLDKVTSPWKITDYGLQSVERGLLIPAEELGLADHDGLPIWPKLVALEEALDAFEFVDRFARALAAHRGRYVAEFGPDWRARLSRWLIAAKGISEFKATVHNYRKVSG